MVLGKLPVLEYPVNLDYSRARASALAVGADRDCLDMCCSLIYHSHFSPSLWETIRYRLKYYRKGPFNPNN